MSRLSLTCLMAFLSTTGAALAADAVRNSAIPIFAPDDSTGWIYNATTQEFIPNLTALDTNGTPYVLALVV